MFLLSHSHVAVKVATDVERTATSCAYAIRAITVILRTDLIRASSARRALRWPAKRVVTLAVLVIETKIMVLLLLLLILFIFLSEM